MKTYIEIKKVGRNWYIVSYDYIGHVIEVSTTYSTKKACKETFEKMLKMDFIAEYKK